MPDELAKFLADNDLIGRQKAAIEKGAQALGIDPIDYATAIDYESGGSYDPWKAGPVTKWGQHRGTIQYGEPQRKKYGVYKGQSFEDQVTRSNVRYLQDAGVKPGMTFDQIYAAINGGSVSRRRSTPDANTGRTIADNIRIARDRHRPNVLKRFGWEDKQTDELAQFLNLDNLSKNEPFELPEVNYPTLSDSGPYGSEDEIAKFKAKFPQVDVKPRAGQVVKEAVGNMLTGGVDGGVPDLDRPVSVPQQPQQPGANQEQATDTDYLEHLGYASSQGEKGMDRDAFMKAANEPIDPKITANVALNVPEGAASQGETSNYDAPATPEERSFSPGGLVETERQVGTATDDLNRVASYFTPDAKKPDKEQFIEAVAAVGSKYGITPDEVRAYADRAYKKKGAKYFDKEVDGRIGVTFDVLNAVKPGVIPNAIRMEQAQGRTNANVGIDLSEPQWSTIDSDVEYLKQNAGTALLATPLFGLSEEQRNALGAQAAGVVLGGGGDTARRIAGLARIANGNGYTGGVYGGKVSDALQAWADSIASKTDRLRQGTKGEGIVSDIVAVADPSAFARLILMSRLPGGIVTAMTLEHATQAAGSGKPWSDIGKEAAKGAALGGVFKAAPLIGRIGEWGVSSAVGKTGQAVAREATTAATIAAGTGLVEQQFGANEEEQKHSMLLNTLFHLGGLGVRLAGKSVRVRDAEGKESVAGVEKDGSVRLLKAGQEPEKPVDIEVAVPPSGPPALKSAPQGRPVENPFPGDEAILVGPSDLEAFKIPEPNAEALARANASPRTTKISTILSEKGTISIDELRQATRYSPANFDQSITDMFEAGLIQYRPGNRVELVQKDAAESTDIYEQARAKYGENAPPLPEPSSLSIQSPDVPAPKTAAPKPPAPVAPEYVEPPSPQGGLDPLTESRIRRDRFTHPQRNISALVEKMGKSPDEIRAILPELPFETDADIAKRYGVPENLVKELRPLGEIGQEGYMAHRVRAITLDPQNEGVFNELSDIFTKGSVRFRDGDYEGRGEIADAVLDKIAQSVGKPRASQMDAKDWDKVLSTHADRMSTDSVKKLIEASDEHGDWQVLEKRFREDPELKKIVERIINDLGVTTWEDFRDLDRHAYAEKKGLTFEQTAGRAGVMTGGPTEPYRKEILKLGRKYAGQRAADGKRLFTDDAIRRAYDRAVYSRTDSPLKGRPANRPSGAVPAASGAQPYVKAARATDIESAVNDAPKLTKPQPKSLDNLSKIDPQAGKRPGDVELVNAISSDKKLGPRWTKLSSNQKRAVISNLPSNATKVEMERAIDEVEEVAFSRPALAKSQTQTPEFKRWFGDSKVVDENGAPLVVYHGTKAGDIAHFSTERPWTEGAVFFTDNHPTADHFALDDVSWNPDDWDRSMEEPIVYPVFLSLQNPKIGTVDEIDIIDTEPEIEQAKKEGHDGLIITGVNESGLENGKGTTYVAFKSEQIKSAIGNRGTFDPNDPNITLSKPSAKTDSQFAQAEERAVELYQKAIDELKRPEDAYTRARVRSHDDHLELNPWALDTVRQAYSRFIGDKAKLFWGAYFTPIQAKAIAVELKDMRREAMGKGNAIAAVSLDRVINAFEKQITKGPGDAIVAASFPNEPMIYEKALQEERLHQADFRARGFKALPIEPYQNIPAYYKAVAAVEPFYEGASKRGLHNEVVAKMFRDDANEVLVLTDAELQDLRKFHLQQLLLNGVTSERIISSYNDATSVTAREWAQSSKDKEYEYARRPDARPDAEGSVINGTAEGLTPARGDASIRGRGLPERGEDGGGSLARGLNEVGARGLSEPSGGSLALRDPVALATARVKETFAEPTEEEVKPSGVLKRVDELLNDFLPDFIYDGKRDVTGAEAFANITRTGYLAGVSAVKNNLGGNLMNVAIEQVVKVPAAGLDMVIAKATGGRRYSPGPSLGDIGEGLFGPTGAFREGIAGEGRGLWGALSKGVQDPTELSRFDLERGTPADPDSWYTKHNVVRNTGVPALDIVIEAVKRISIGVDRPYKAFERTSDLRGLTRIAAKNDLKAGFADNLSTRQAQYKADPGKNMLESAERRAEMVTFQSPNAVTDWYDKIKAKLIGGKGETEAESDVHRKVGAAAYVALSQLVPFARTPSNMWIQAMEYTPYGVISFASKLAKLGKGYERRHEMERLEKKWKKDDAQLKRERGVADKAFRKKTKEKLDRYDEQFARKKAELTPEQFKAWQPKWKEARDAWRKERADKLSKALEKRAAIDESTVRVREAEAAREQEKFNEFEQRALRETFGRATVGNIMGALLMFGVLKGLVDAIGDIDYDEDKKRWEDSRDAGIPENSINIGGRRFSLATTPLGMALSMELTALHQMQRPGRVDEKASAAAWAAGKSVLSFNPFTAERAVSDDFSEKAGSYAVAATPGVNLKILQEVGELMDEKARSTRGQGFMGQYMQRIPKVREYLPESKHPLGERGDVTDRLGRLFDPTRSKQELAPQSSLHVEPHPSQKYTRKRGRR